MVKTKTSYVNNIDVTSDSKGFCGLEERMGIKSMWSAYITQRATYGILSAMTNPDSTFKSRDITLPTKVRLVKAMVFPAVMYGCESWTVKKAEH